MINASTLHNKCAFCLDVHAAAHRSGVAGNCAALHREFAAIVHGHAAALAVERVAAGDLAGLFRAAVLQDK